jgi:hypothetical protein
MLGKSYSRWVLRRDCLMIIFYLPHETPKGYFGNLKSPSGLKGIEVEMN